MRTRRLFLLIAVVVAPLAAACVSPTGLDSPPPPAPTDTTGRKEQQPWG